MPELPEVETIRRSLSDGSDAAPAVLGKVISGVEVFWERTIAKPGAQEFKTRIVDQQIQLIQRRGKYLHFELSRDHLIAHLRMSGDIYVEPGGSEIAPHHRVLVNFRDGWRMAFNDTRKFGRLWLVDDPEEVFAKLGPEPLSSEFSAGDLYQRLVARKRQLKPLLMDQSFIAGIGNIYADEALHKAHLHPLKRSDLITIDESNLLWESIRQVLEEGIRRNGASIDWVYRGGDFQNYFRVYQRTGEACIECGTPIERIVVGQRATHFCPLCQPLE